MAVQNTVRSLLRPMLVCRRMISRWQALVMFAPVDGHQRSSTSHARISQSKNIRSSKLPLMCDTTERASQRLSPYIKEYLPTCVREAGDKPVDPTTLTSTNRTEAQPLEGLDHPVDRRHHVPDHCPQEAFQRPDHGHKVLMKNGSGERVKIGDTCGCGIKLANWWMC